MTQWDLTLLTVELVRLRAGLLTLTKLAILIIIIIIIITKMQLISY